MIELLLWILVWLLAAGNPAISGEFAGIGLADPVIVVVSPGGGGDDDEDADGGAIGTVPACNPHCTHGRYCCPPSD